MSTINVKRVWTEIHISNNLQLMREQDTKQRGVQGGVIDHNLRKHGFSYKALSQPFWTQKMEESLGTL